APALRLYDAEAYPGHAAFVSRALGSGVSFREFKLAARRHQGRRYLPFFLYDLRPFPIALLGTARTWAVRIEDYQYDDDPEQMAATALKLARAIGRLTGAPRGIVVLATSPAIKPNTSIAPALAA